MDFAAISSFSVKYAKLCRRCSKEELLLYKMDADGTAKLAYCRMDGIIVLEAGGRCVPGLGKER